VIFLWFQKFLYILFDLEKKWEGKKLKKRKKNKKILNLIHVFNCNFNSKNTSIKYQIVKKQPYKIIISTYLSHYHLKYS
jgi:hypothetical protein